MTTRQSEILDKALERLQKEPGMGFSPALPGDESVIDLMVAAAGMVQALPALATPNQAQAQADREMFLARLEQLPAPTTPAKTWGFAAWLSQLLPTRAKSELEPRPLVPVFARTILLIVVVLIASLGGTAVLSASALPTSPIYPVKLMLEEARLSVNENPASETTLHLAFAAERVQEMARLAAVNQAAEQANLENFRGHWRQALQLAGEMPAHELQLRLLQMQEAAAEQEMLLAQAQNGVTQQTMEKLQEAEFSLGQVQTAVQLGLQNQDRFRWHMQNLPQDWPGAGYDFGSGPGDCEGGCGAEGGFTPVPGYGPGDNDEPGEEEDPGHEDDPGDKYPGDDDPGDDEPADKDPGNEPGDEDPRSDDPGEDKPGYDDTTDDFPRHDAPGKNGPGGDDPGQGGPGPNESGNQNPGPADPGRGEPGKDEPGSTDPGNDDPGNKHPGNDDGDDPGNDDPGNDDPGQGGSGNDDPGNGGPGHDDPGNDDPGKDGGDPGKDDPGNDDPGKDGDDPGNDDPGKDDPGDDDPGDDDPGDGGPGDDDPGDDDPGNDDPGKGDPGNDDPGRP